MKSQFVLTCILGSAIFTSQVAPVVALESSSLNQPASLTTSIEVQEYVRNVAENVYKTAEAILSIPPEDQSFENTLKPWNELSARLSQDFKILNVLAESHSSCSSAAFQALEDLDGFLTKITQNPQLHRAFHSCCHRLSNDDRLNPMQSYMVSCFLQNSFNEPLHLRGSSEEKNNSETNFTVLDFEPDFFLDRKASDLARKIFSVDADVICIRQVSADDAYDLYETLREGYVHFIYVSPCANLLDPSKHRVGLLIASNYSVEKIRFNRFQMSKPTEGFFDFVVNNGNSSLGHIYVANLQKDLFEDTQTLKFVQIIENMQDGCLKMEERSVPFFLCGNLRTLEDSQESKVLMDTYFHENNSSGIHATLLLRSSPDCPTTAAGLGYAFSTDSVELLDHLVGSLTTIKQESPYCICPNFKNREIRHLGENYVIPCGGSAEASVSQDTQGNTSLDLGLGLSGKLDNGADYSLDIDAGIQRDSEGNVTGRVETSATVRW